MDASLILRSRKILLRKAAISPMLSRTQKLGAIRFFVNAILKWHPPARLASKNMHPFQTHLIFFILAGKRVLISPRNFSCQKKFLAYYYSNVTKYICKKVGGRYIKNKQSINNISFWQEKGDSTKKRLAANYVIKKSSRKKLIADFYFYIIYIKYRDSEGKDIIIYSQYIIYHFAQKRGINFVKYLTSYFFL